MSFPTCSKRCCGFFFIIIFVHTVLAENIFNVPQKKVIQVLNDMMVILSHDIIVIIG